jgi:cellulose biosynthesis protein BcsQ
MTRDRGQIITFYSFKGGVGRSMALANVASILAQRGKKVLVLDFDFEAPGLHRYFLNAPNVEPPLKEPRFTPRRRQKGVIDLFRDLRKHLRQATLQPGQLEDAGSQPALREIVARTLGSESYKYHVNLRNPSEREGVATIDFVAAGRFDEKYAERVRAFDWKRFYADYGEVIPILAEQLASHYDYVLIDSRTGFTDIGSLCTIVMPDKLVLVFAPNQQSLAGALDVGEQAIRERSIKRDPFPVFPLISRLEDTEEKEKRRWVNLTRESFESLFRDAYGMKACDLESYFDQVRVYHRGYYAYGERIAAEEEKPGVAGSMAESFRVLTDRLSAGPSPRRLLVNKGKCSMGAMVFGTGFVLSPPEAQSLIERDAKNADVIEPYLTGDDLNRRPDQSAARLVVNFRDWSLQAASSYPQALRHVEVRVKPERASKPTRVSNVPWWQFLRPRRRLYDAIAQLSRVLVRARVSKYNAVAFVDRRAVFSEQVIVFAFDDWPSFATLQSSVHDEWSTHLMPTIGMGADGRYGPADCFETFPFPSSTASLGPVGDRYHGHRASVMLERQEGMTHTYNRFHDPSEGAADIKAMRDLQVEMDEEVVRAYGWDDLRLGHGFRAADQQQRFAISAPARAEVLDRLLVLNRQRYADEVAEGLHKDRLPATGKDAGVGSWPPGVW